MRGEDLIRDGDRKYLLDKPPAEWPLSVIIRFGRYSAAKYVRRFGIKVFAQVSMLVKRLSRRWETFDLVANDDGEAVLIDVRTDVGEDENQEPKAEITKEEKARMLNAVVRYMKDNPRFLTARHDVVKVLVISKDKVLVRPYIGVVWLDRDQLALYEE